MERAELRFSSEGLPIAKVQQKGVPMLLPKIHVIALGWHCNCWMAPRNGIQVRAICM